MARTTSVADRLIPLLERVLGDGLPVRVRGWDGSEGGPPDAPVLYLRSRRALRRLLWQPNELGLGRAYVAGELDVDGDLYEALDRLATLAEGRNLRRLRLSMADRRDMARTALLLGALGPQPKPPAEEARVAGVKHSRRRDRAAVSHHYDVGNDFYRMVLGPSMVYSCAYWTSTAPEYTLADAQRDKIDRVCRKLGLRPGMRLLDVGCGWGSLLAHAASEYGVEAVGITLSREQAEYAQKRLVAAGLADRVQVRLQDYREVSDGPYDAIASVGMAEHVGADRYRQYAQALFSLLRPGGRLLNHQIANRPVTAASRTTFIQAYVFPDGELLPVGLVTTLLEEAGFEVRDLEAMREHYGRTLRAWVANLEENMGEAVALTSPGRARVWRLYMAGSALAFERNRIGVNQVLAVKPHRSGRSEMPATRAELFAG